MPDQKTIEQVQQEVHTPNHVRKFEQEKKHKELEATEQSARDSQVLEMQHHNWLLDNSGKHMQDFFKEIETSGKDWTLKEFKEKLDKQMKVIFNTKEKK